MTTTSRRPPRTPPKGKSPARRAAAKKPPKAPGKAAKAAEETKAPTKAAKATKAPAKATKAPAKAPAKAAAETAAKSATKRAAKAAAAGTAVKAPAARASKARAEVAPRRAGQSPPRTPFILLIVGLLGGALVSLLLLNTVLAKDAFTLTRLQQSNERLAEREQELALDVARGRSPENLAKIAESLGMKPNEVPVFFDTDTGRPSGQEIRPVPHADAAAAGAASVIGVPGTVVPGDGAAR
ncbi:hypothetical protein [Actinomadura sp. WAC 06369]|uniref:hypothetical protein n=1 Tax=Actinomadura sp. WAC 06369 TaxID=2203193 RepID=UPI000F7B16E9|nr:hypothetical protein [Actinomadura sp. WAC 06369]RSN51162.1 hypothetical protein DMH08_31295 [Actinomadura sp. WAC 06369]